MVLQGIFDGEAEICTTCRHLKMSLSHFRFAGAAFQQNNSFPFYSLHNEIALIGAVSGFSARLPTTVADNGWGGVLVGNFCANHWFAIRDQQVVVSAVAFVRNLYHPAFEYHSCQNRHEPITGVRMSASRCEGGEQVTTPRIK